MKSKTMNLILLTLCILSMVIPAVQAAPFDWWYKQSAYTGLTNEHPELAALDASSWDIQVVSGLLYGGRGRWYKYVEISYGCEDYNLYWRGKVFAFHYGLIETEEFDYTITPPPEPEPEVAKLKIKLVRYGPMWYWDGGQWVYNEPVCFVSDMSGTVLIEGLGFSRTTKTVKGWCLAVYLPLDAYKDTVTFRIVS